MAIDNRTFTFFAVTKETFKALADVRSGNIFTMRVLVTSVQVYSFTLIKIYKTVIIKNIIIELE